MSLIPSCCRSSLVQYCELKRSGIPSERRFRLKAYEPFRTLMSSTFAKDFQVLWLSNENVFSLIASIY